MAQCNEKYWPAMDDEGQQRTGPNKNPDANDLTSTERNAKDPYQDRSTTRNPKINDTAIFTPRKMHLRLPKKAELVMCSNPKDASTRKSCTKFAATIKITRAR